MKLPFLFGIHCHQPVGNFGYVVDEAVEKCYAPFMKTALKFDKFRFAVHYSGWLLDYVRQHHCGVFADMKKLADNNQIEFFTGGYYEPVLSSIPSRDRVGQINKLSGYIQNHFGQKPDGLWLTERVWDSSIIPDVAEAGVSNMIVDDYHFLSAGFYKEMLNGYYITEQDGIRVNMFPIDKELRYIIPFREEDKILEYVESLADGGGKCATIFDDGEKFGVWPSTHEWVYEQGWLERFLDVVTSSEKCEFSFFKDTVEKVKPSGLAYLPVTSYYEMGEWSLFSGRTGEMEKLQDFLKNTEFEKSAEVFVKGGIWKNFLVKYPESNRIHKRALRLSAFAAEMNDPALTEALYKAQCNDALWHGIFGGLYLPNLRNNSWSFIIEAEKEYERLKGFQFPVIETGDFGYDGYDEAYIRTEKYNAMFTARDCGQMVSFELKDKNFNIINTLARRKEAYHSAFEEQPESEEVQAHEGISTIHSLNVEITDEMREKLVYDWYNKNCFVDHVVAGFIPKDFAACSFGELSDLANTPAEIKALTNSLEAERKGGLYVGGEKYELNIKKKYTFEPEGMAFEIELETAFGGELDYVLELNFHFMHMKEILLNGKSVEEAVADGVSFTLTDGICTATAEVSTSTEASANVFSTVSQSEKGVDLTEQGVSLFIANRFKIGLKLDGYLRIV